MYRILLADDEGIMLESLKKIIETEYGNECEIHTAKTGRVVVEEAEKYPPDICFMDIQMPVMDGYQAAEAIRAVKRIDAKTIPVLALTANAFATDIGKAHSAGMNDHVAKPIEVERLIETLQKWLG